MIGVIGKSSDEYSNKMAGLDMAKFAPPFARTVANGEIKIYYDLSTSTNKTLYLHFQTPFDVRIMEEMLVEWTAEDDDGTKKSKDENMTFNSFVRSRFAQMLLFAIHVCHLIVLVEPNNVFDTSYLPIFKALKIIRSVEKVSVAQTVKCQRVLFAEKSTS